MQHIEQAGIHSGDSACSLPPYQLSDVVQHELVRQTGELAFALGVIGLMNIQFAVKDDQVYVLEVNPRASRTVPFVSKAVGLALAKIAVLCMVDQSLSDQSVAMVGVATPGGGFFAVKRQYFHLINSQVLILCSGLK